MSSRSVPRVPVPRPKAPGVRPELLSLLQTPFDLAPLSREVVLYGAGKTGRMVGGYLEDAGYRVRGFLDAAARPGQQVGNLPVYGPTQAASLGATGECDLVVAIHNYGVDMAAVLAQVGQLGFRRTVNMIEFHNLFPDGQPFRYWLAARSFYRDHAAAIDAAAALLGDEASRRWFEEILEFRLTGNYRRLSAPSLQDQYMPQDLPRWAERLRFVDCGAFDGDTVEALAAAGYSFEAIAAFEPDPQNFALLSRGLRRHGPAICFPCGVADSTRVARFEAGEGMASREAEEGSTMVQCVALDEAIAGFRPNLIKMDIEGAELDALQGARELIAAERPALAIALYHRPEHLWEIPLRIASWGLDYRFEIRSHAYSSFDTDLYALPRAGKGRTTTDH